MRRRLHSLRNREELQLAKDRAEAANRAKSHFLAAASHDLRQPTQALGLFIATLRAMARRPQLRGEEVGHIVPRRRLTKVIGGLRYEGLSVTLSELDRAHSAELADLSYRIEGGVAAAG